MSTAFGGLVTDVDTEAKYPLGMEVVLPAQSAGSREHRGMQTWVYVFNDDPTYAFAEGTVVVRDADVPQTQLYFGATIAPATNEAAAMSIIGVAQHAIAVGSYGWVLKKGVGSVLAGTDAVAVDNLLITGGSAVGVGKPYNPNTAVGLNVFDHVGIFGQAITAGTSAVFTAWVNCLGS